MPISALGSSLPYGTMTLALAPKSLRYLLNALRAVCLIAALGLWGVTAFWPRVSAGLGALDSRLIKGHVASVEAQIERGRELLRERDRLGSIYHCERVAESLRDVRKGDRRGPARTEVLELLTASLQREGRLDEALARTEELLGFNGQDFPALLRRGTLLDQLGRRAEALAAMEETMRVGPQVGAAQLLYLDLLARGGEQEKVVETLLDLGSRGPLVVPHLAWDLRWAVDQTMDFRPRMDLDLVLDPATGLYRASLPVTGEALRVDGLRFDPPSGALVHILAIHCRVQLSGGEIREFSADDVVQTHDMVANEGKFTTSGGTDPYVILRQPDLTSLQGVVQFTIEMKLAPALPERVESMLRQRFESDSRARWVERYGERAVQQLEAFHE